MKIFSVLVLCLSKFMRAVGGIALVGMMLITVLDVTLRYFGRPILGTYELVFLAGAIVIGFSIPQNSLDDSNVYVDFLVTAAPRPVMKLLKIGTRLLGIGLFLLLGYALVSKAIHLCKVGEVSNTLHIPLYLVGYALGACAFAESIVLIYLLVGGSCGGGNHE